MRRFSLVFVIMVAAFALASAITYAQAQPRQAGAKAAASASSPVNLNTATAAQLETLPGIGPAASKRILDYRTKNGSFKKIEEFSNITFLPVVVERSAPHGP